MKMTRIWPLILLVLTVACDQAEHLTGPTPISNELACYQSGGGWTVGQCEYVPDPTLEHKRACLEAGGAWVNGKCIFTPPPPPPPPPSHWTEPATVYRGTTTEWKLPVPGGSVVVLSTHTNGRTEQAPIQTAWCAATCFYVTTSGSTFGVKLGGSASVTRFTATSHGQTKVVTVQ